VNRILLIENNKKNTSASELSSIFFKLLNKVGSGSDERGGSPFSPEPIYFNLKNNKMF